MESSASTIAISYTTIRELALFQEQYDRLSHERQQVQVQLDSSPSLPADAPRAAQRPSVGFTRQKNKKAFTTENH